jgi:biotin carboxyl carrier protein
VRHQVQALVGAVRVDGADVRVHKTSPGRFMVTVDTRPEPLYAVAHGDVIHVHLKGRAWKIERLDPTRSTAAAVSAGAGAAHAPMPGVVVSMLVSRGQCVRQGDALLVIESMKMQMTISASIDGEVAEIPMLVGQTFQRGDVLVRVQATR